MYRQLRRSARNLARTASTAFEIATRHRAVSSLSWRHGHVVADVRHTPAGAVYVHLLDLGVGRPLYTGGAYEQEESAFLTNSLRPGMTVLDVGANIGYLTLIASRAVGDNGRVLAIEPEPGNAALLADNIARNDRTNITVCACAVGSAPGTATLYRSDWNMGNHRVNAGAAGKSKADDAVTVPIETGDRLVAQHRLSSVDLVKMDVEGYEPGVIAGLTQTLARDRPIILTEFWPHGMRDAGFDPRRFLADCLAIGYDAYRIEALDRPLGSVEAIMRTLPSEGPDVYENLVFKT